ncbi:MAG: hypothetical protein JF924_00990 [Candidatus Dormibacteraeota bacterium]|nr:hypothetical protein [Candidatus Dormibacteraeota bacterium]
MSFDAIRLRRPDGAKPGDTKAALAEVERTRQLTTALAAQLPVAARAALVLAYADPDRWARVANLLGTACAGSVSFDTPLHIQPSLQALEVQIHSALDAD